MKEALMQFLFVMQDGQAIALSSWGLVVSFLILWSFLTFLRGLLNPEMNVANIIAASFAHTVATVICIVLFWLVVGTVGLTTLVILVVILVLGSVSIIALTHAGKFLGSRK